MSSSGTRNSSYRSMSINNPHQLNTVSTNYQHGAIANAEDARNQSMVVLHDRRRHLNQDAQYTSSSNVAPNIWNNRDTIQVGFKDKQ